MRKEELRINNYELGMTNDELRMEKGKLFPIHHSLFLILFLFLISSVFAQQDSISFLADTVIKPASVEVQQTKQQVALRLDSLEKTEKVQDTSSKKDSIIIVKEKHDPHKATRRSAMIPGWGQAYNKEYWKIPIVWGALAIPTYLFFDNNKWYQRCKDAYVIYATHDTANYVNVHPDLTKFENNPSALQHYRNEFRKYRDYSILWFFILWGVNVADATVFGHLKGFDVSDDLSMRIKPTYNFSLRTPGVNMVFNFKDNKKVKAKAIP